MTKYPHGPRFSVELLCWCLRQRIPVAPTPRARGHKIAGETNSTSFPWGPGPLFSSATLIVIIFSIHADQADIPKMSKVRIVSFLVAKKWDVLTWLETERHIDVGGVQQFSITFILSRLKFAMFTFPSDSKPFFSRFWFWESGRIHSCRKYIVLYKCTAAASDRSSFPSPATVHLEATHLERRPFLHLDSTLHFECATDLTVPAKKRALPFPRKLQR